MLKQEYSSGGIGGIPPALTLTPIYQEIEVLGVGFPPFQNALSWKKKKNLNHKSFLVHLYNFQ